MRKILFAIILFPVLAFAQFNDYQPEYNWYTIQGKHVFVHFHEGAERTAKTVAKIADEVWGPITSLYEYEPDPVHFVIKDIDDYSNGATYFFDNKIEIWASALDFDLRGTHNWLRNVISHEFTHMVQIQSAMKVGRSIPAFYLQFMNYEDKRRPDILYGYPNAIVSYPIATINVPAWFAEGTAQYMRKEFGYDYWDSHRDMILRSYALENKLLTWNEMGIFDKTSLGNESVYNAGFALTKYIAQKYGDEKISEISHKLGKPFNFTIDAAFEDVLGKNGNQIYDEWSSFLKADYKKRTAEVESNLVQGDILLGEGFGNFLPVYSPDEKKIAYISNKTSDYFGMSGLYLYDVETKQEKLLDMNVRSTTGFFDSGNKLVYAKLSEHNPKWANIHDLYVYDVAKDDETRITFGLRANNPDVSADGEKIVFLFQKDGTTNVGSVDIDGKNFKRLTFFEDGEQVYNPRFAPDGKTVYFSYSYKDHRDIAKVDTSGSRFEVVLTNGFDNRDPIITNSGKMIYSSDASGIFNLYEYDFASKKSTQLSNVTGGAFQPDADAEDNIVYSGYTSDGFKIFYLSSTEQKNVDPAKKYVVTNNPPLGEDKPKGDMQKFNINALRDFDDHELPDYEVKKYTGFFSKISFIPFIRYDNYNISNSGLDKIKPGVYIASSDYLNRFSIFGGGSINRRMERDLFLSFEYRDKLPILFSLGIKPEMAVELYSVSRKTNTDIIFDSLDATQNTKTDVTYNLFEVDLVAKHKIIGEGHHLETRYIFSRYSATLGSFIIPVIEQLYPTTNDTYLIGNDFQIKYNYDGILPTVDTDINPIGRKIELKYDYEANRFNSDNEYTVVDGMLKPLYKNFDFHRLELNWKEFMNLGKGHTLTAQLRAATIFGPEMPEFFNFYLGGLVGMKSYPFYAVSGNELGWLNLTYRFPLFKNIDARVGHLNIEKIFLSVYGDFGNAWNGKFPELNSFKKGAGAEIRIKMSSFYLFPTSFFFDAAYSFDKFSRKIFGETVSYGKEWSFYGGILFDFNF